MGHYHVAAVCNTELAVDNTTVDLQIINAPLQYFTCLFAAQEIRALSMTAVQGKTLRHRGRTQRKLGGHFHLPSHRFRHCVPLLWWLKKSNTSIHWIFPQIKMVGNNCSSCSTVREWRGVQVGAEGFPFFCTREVNDLAISLYMVRTNYTSLHCSEHFETISINLVIVICTVQEYKCIVR